MKLVKQTNLSVWADEAGKADDASISKQFRHFRDTTNVFLSVSRSETEVLVETMTDVVSIETVRWDTLTHEVLFEGEGDRCLASARET